MKCLYCGKEFKIYPYRKNDAKYCSYECYHKATRLNLDTVCKNCGNTFRKRSRKDTQKFCSVECVREYKRKQPKTAKASKDGYKRIWQTDGKGIKEHIYIMEKLIGRKLQKNECVHHIDGNRANNDISNLQLMTISEHSKLHREREIEQGKKLFGRE